MNPFHSTDLAQLCDNHLALQASSM